MPTLVRAGEPAASTSQNKRACKICLEESDCLFALTPCGHANFCLPCYNTLTATRNTPKKCPTCGGIIDGKQRIFVD